jgi:hypothetical protein
MDVKYMVIFKIKDKATLPTFQLDIQILKDALAIPNAFDTKQLAFFITPEGINFSFMDESHILIFQIFIPKENFHGFEVETRQVTLIDLPNLNEFLEKKAKKTTKGDTIHFSINEDATFLHTQYNTAKADIKLFDPKGSKFDLVKAEKKAFKEGSRIEFFDFVKDTEMVTMKFSSTEFLNILEFCQTMQDTIAIVAGKTGFKYEAEGEEGSIWGNYTLEDKHYLTSYSAFISEARMQAIANWREMKLKAIAKAIKQISFSQAEAKLFSDIKKMLLTTLQSQLETKLNQLAGDFFSLSFLIPTLRQLKKSDDWCNISIASNAPLYIEVLDQRFSSFPIKVQIALAPRVEEHEDEISVLESKILKGEIEKGEQIQTIIGKAIELQSEELSKNIKQALEEPTRIASLSADGFINRTRVIKQKILF